jgi:hypothetical protein
VTDSSLFEGLRDEVEDTSPTKDIIRDQFRMRREVVPVRKNRGSDDTIHTFSMRCRVTTSNRFVEWCNEERLTYREGFDRLMELLAKNSPR